MMTASVTSSFLSKVTGILIVLVIFLLVRMVIPGLIEDVQYALTKGKQRAEYETAREFMRDASLKGLSKAFHMVSQKVAPSVIHINVQSSTPTLEDDERLAQSIPRHPALSGQGSGVIVDPSGYVVTNSHVIAGAERILVSLSDGRVTDATIVGTDSLTDISVLKINVPDLIAAEWGDSDSLEVGALVWAVGSPFGLERSITAGILSAKNRAGRAGTAHQDFLQTDAAVNPGNSGGPLVDDQGRVVGINTAIVGEAYQGIGFSVPSSVAREVYERIRETGKVARGWLGVQLSMVPSDDTASGTQQEGALVERISIQDGVPSPAQRAGIRAGDVVIRWNGQAVRSPDGLTRMVGKTPVGTVVEVVVRRSGEEIPLQVEVAERPQKVR